MTPWLDVIGIGEEGWDGLAPAARARLEAAEIIIGGDRHHGLAPHLAGERLRWPSPFSGALDRIAACRGRPTALLVTGDPLWYSAGALILRHVPAAEVTFHPQLSSFQWAAARLGWSLADLETLTVHGRPAEQVRPFLGHGQRLLVLTRDGDSPAEIARLLCADGFGASTLHMLAHLGGPEETRRDATAATWEGRAPDLHVLAIGLVADPGTRPLPPTGLPDEAFVHDGRMTKQEVRSITLAALAPRRGELLWDVGLGCGSVAIEWMRAARDMRAIGIEPRADRRALAATNAARLGAPRLDIRDGTAPAALQDLPDPDAIFIGGGLDVASAELCLSRLKPFGRLVANAVTLESADLLGRLHARHGGLLRRIAIERAAPVGPHRGWKPFMPVTQWSLAR